MRHTFAFGVASVLFVSLCACAAVNVWHWSSLMNDYSVLRIWDRYANAGVDRGTAGDAASAERELKNALTLTGRMRDAIPYRQISQNRLSGIYLEQGKVEQAQQLALATVSELRPLVQKRREKSDQGELVRAFEFIRALNRLGIIARQRGDRVEAVRLFKQNIGILDEFDGKARGSIPAFREEQMVALINLMETSDAHDEVSEQFGRARILDERYVFETSLSKRLQSIAQILRSKQLGRPKDLTPTFQESIEIIQQNPAAYDADLSIAMSSSFRTREDNYNILVECLRLAKVWTQLGQPEKANSLLLTLGKSTVPEGTLSASLCLELGSQLNLIGAQRVAIEMLNRANRKLSLLRPSPIQRAELNCSVGLRLLVLGDISALSYLRSNFTIHKNNSKSSVHHRLQLTEAAVIYANALVKFGKPHEALATLDAIPSRPGLPPDPRVTKWRWAAASALRKLEILAEQEQSRFEQMRASERWLDVANSANRLARLSMENGSGMKKAKSYILIGLSASKKEKSQKMTWSGCLLRSKLATIYIHEKKYSAATKVLENNIQIMRNYGPRNAAQDQVLAKDVRNLGRIAELAKSKP